MQWIMAEGLAWNLKTNEVLPCGRSTGGARGTTGLAMASSGVETFWTFPSAVMIAVADWTSVLKREGQMKPPVAWESEKFKGAEGAEYFDSESTVLDIL